MGLYVWLCLGREAQGAKRKVPSARRQAQSVGYPILFLIGILLFVPFGSLPFALGVLSSNHPVRPRQHVRRNRQADLLGGFQIDDELELVGCSTGRSAGFAPFKILSTYVAARRNKSVILMP